MASENALLTALRYRIEQAEPVRKRARRTGWIQTAIYVVLFLLLLPWLGLVAIGSVWVLGNYILRDPGPVLIAVVLIGAVAVAATGFYLAVRLVSRWGKAAEPAYERTFGEVVLLPCLREVLAGNSVSLDGAIDLAAFEASGLFRQQPDDFSARFGVTGDEGGVPFRGSVLSVYKWRYSSKQQGRVRVSFFRGIFVQVDRPVPLQSTLRLAHAQVYEGWEKGQWGIERRENTKRSQGGNPEFDRVAMVVFDEEQTSPPTIHPSWMRAWLDIHTLMGKPVFLSFNATGVYLAVATGMSRLPLEPRLYTSNKPEELEEDLTLIRKTISAIEILRRAMPLGNY